MPGLTDPQPLEAFWKQPGAVDQTLYRKFRAHVLLTIQHNGAFYKRLEGTGTPTGVRWTKPR
jgi:capsule polysaccharide modification protein KpsS